MTMKNIISCIFLMLSSTFSYAGIFDYIKEKYYEVTGNSLEKKQDEYKQMRVELAAKEKWIANAEIEIKKLTKRAALYEEEYNTNVLNSQSLRGFAAISKRIDINKDIVEGYKRTNKRVSKLTEKMHEEINNMENYNHKLEEYSKIYGIEKDDYMINNEPKSLASIDEALASIDEAINEEIYGRNRVLETSISIEGLRNKKYTQQLAEPQKTHNKKIVELKEMHNKQIAELQKMHDKQIAELKEMHDKQKAELKEMHDKQIAKLKEKDDYTINNEPKPVSSDNLIDKAIDDRNNLGKKLKDQKGKVKTNPLETDRNFVNNKKDKLDVSFGSNKDRDVVINDEL